MQNIIIQIISFQLVLEISKKKKRNTINVNKIEMILNVIK